MGCLPMRSGSDPVRRAPTSRDLPPYERARLGIGYVPQGREIFPRLTVEENLRDGPGAHKPGSTPHAGELFELFPVLKEMLHRRGGDLSGGQQQQLAIARALALRPKLLILDEPTEGIQPSIIKDIGRVIRSAARRAARWRSCWSSSTTTSRDARRPLPGDGARRGRRARRGRGDGCRRCEIAADGLISASP